MEKPKLRIAGKEGEFKKLDSTPPPDANAKSVMTLEATVDVKPQELKTVRSFAQMVGSVPGILPAEAQIVLNALFDVFSRQGEVKEGLIGDLVWGFAQCGIPQALTVAGLVHLEVQGYVKFQSKDNQYVDFSSDQITGAWVRYQQKLLNMVYGG